MYTEEERTSLLERVTKLECEVAALSTPTSVPPWDGRIDIEATNLVEKLGGDCTLWHFMRIGSKLSLRTCLMVPNDNNTYRTLVIQIPDGVDPHSIEAWECVKVEINRHFTTITSKKKENL